MRSTMFPKSKPAKTAPKTIILPVGLLHKINSLATIKAFQTLSDNKLTNGRIETIMPMVLKLDGQFKSGKMEDASQFRKEINVLLEMKLSNEQFDMAWNAMQGDVKSLAPTLKKIKAEFPDANIVLISKTDPIHVGDIFQKLESEVRLPEQNPMTLLGFPLYVSYQVREYESELDLYNEVLLEEKARPAETVVILQSESNNPIKALKEQDEAIVSHIKAWAAEKCIGVVDKAPEEDIISAIKKAKNLPEVQPKKPAGCLLM
jgi:hypothetical protein